ncbi:MAG: hypothetical protein WD118_06695 [Phycisphaeraceae bacterium]
MFDLTSRNQTVPAEDVVAAIIDPAELEALVLEGLDAPPAEDDDRPAEALAGRVVQAFMLGQGWRVAEHRAAWLAALDKRQLADGTWPYDPNWRREIRIIGQVSAAYFLLGGRPRHRIALVDELQERQRLERWLAARNWASPWGGAGHDVIGLIQTMANLGIGSSGVACQVMDYVERLVDPESGHIAVGYHDEPGDQQFGACFAFGILYAFLHRGFPWADRLLDFLFTRQHASGSWAEQFPGGSFNMDAAWLLSRYTRLLPHRRAEAEAALRRLADYLRGELACRVGDERRKAALAMHKTIGLLAEVFPSPTHGHRIWRFATDVTIHP